MIVTKTDGNELVFCFFAVYFLSKTNNDAKKPWQIVCMYPFIFLRIVNTYRSMYE